jgi:squalene synthase HpnC
MRLLPRLARAELRAIYRYARFVDDVGDRAVGDRVALLNLVRADVHRLAAQRAELEPVQGLGPLLRAHDMPIQPALDLIEANLIDQRVTRYETFDDLLAYCALSAAPIGRMVLSIADAADVATLAASDAICAALQILEHCQDVGEDARAGRVYLPGVELRAAGVERADLLADAASPALRATVARQVQRSTELLEMGHALLPRLSGWARVAVTGYVAGGRATSAALRAADYDVLGGQLRPSKARTVLEAALVAAGR